MTRKKKKSRSQQQAKVNTYWQRLRSLAKKPNPPKWALIQLANVAKKRKKKRLLETRTDQQIWYQDVYLESDLWKSIKRKVITRDEHRCVTCGADADVVHHISYAKDVMDGKNLDQLISLCKSCHHRVHFDDDKKVSVNEAEKRLDAMIKNPPS